MPTRICCVAKCPETATYKGRCPGHARHQEKAEHPNRGLYSSKRWRLLRRHVLLEQPICAWPGCRFLAEDVDHIVPVERGGPTWKRGNLQALCHGHHSEKTRREMLA